MKDFIQKHVDIEVDERHIFCSYRKRAIKTRPIKGKPVKIPRIMLVKCSNQLKQTLFIHMSRLIGQRHPTEGYGYYIDKNVPEAHRDTIERNKSRLQEIHTKNKGKLPKDGIHYHIAGTNLYVNGKVIKPDIMPPTPIELMEFADGKEEALQAITLVPSDVIKESDSKFRAFAAKVSSLDDAKLVYIKVALEELNADHIMMAYSFKAAGETHSGVSNDWEIGGGLTMKYFL